MVDRGRERPLAGVRLTARGRLPRATFERAYRLLCDLTPLKEDCGRLCNSRCCRGVEEQAGMYLFPGEECMFTGEEDWLRFEDHLVSERRFCPQWDGRLETVTFVVCRGTCPRERRPLACRLFPLAPLFAPDEVGGQDVGGNKATETEVGGDGVPAFKVTLDPDAVLVCPLVRSGGLGPLDPEFVRACGRVFSLLAADPLILADFKWRSARWRAEERESSPWRRLLG